MKARIFAGWLTGGLVGVAGCATSETDVRVPAMPTVAPRTAAATPVSEAERVATALRRAREGEFAAAAAVVAEAGVENGARLAGRVVTTLAAEDPARAAALAVALRPGTGQFAALETASRAWARRDVEGAARWALGQTDTATGLTARRWVAEEWVATGSSDAVERMLALPAEPRRDELLAFAAAAWTRRDAEAAIAWARGLPEGELRGRLLSSVGFELAQTDPARAMAIAEMLPAGKNRWLLTGALAQTWVVKDAKAAFAWAKEMPAGEARDAAYAGLDTGLGIPSSRRVANAPGVRGGASRTRGGTAAVATAWREGDAPSFQLWLEGQRPGMTREEAILEYVRQRGPSEPAAIGQWLTTLPPGPARERAIQTHVEAVLATSPRDAAQVLSTLPRSEQTPEMLERTARRLLVTDPAAAERWISSSALPEYRKQELLREIRRD